MFNVGGGEVLLILLIGLVVLGPDKLPDFSRKAGRFLHEVRRMSSGFQQEIRNAIDQADQAPPAGPAPDRPAATVDRADPDDRPGAADRPDAEGGAGGSGPA